MRAAAASELAEQSLGPATRFALLPDPFPFWRGGTLSGGRVAYETWGELNEARDNALLLFTDLSPSAHAASSPQDPSPGWWEKMVGPGKAIDTNRYFVFSSDTLVNLSPGDPNVVTTGPASIDPDTGKPYGYLSEKNDKGFPIVSIRDFVEVQKKLVEMGYASVPLVEDSGTFSIRGDILDVFSPLYPRPVRLEFFGDTIESMRVFDPETQRTVDSLKDLIHPPARELLFNSHTRPNAEAADGRSPDAGLGRPARPKRVCPWTLARSPERAAA